ncbi:MAG: hypothetical protein ACSLEN_14240 [Candidatus Malihini olakiniferum]
MTEAIKVFAQYLVYAGLIVLSVWLILDDGYRKGVTDTKLKQSRTETQQAAGALNDFIAGGGAYCQSQSLQRATVRVNQ